MLFYFLINASIPIPQYSLFSLHYRDPYNYLYIHVQSYPRVCIYYLWHLLWIIKKYPQLLSQHLFSGKPFSTTPMPFSHPSQLITIYFPPLVYYLRPTIFQQSWDISCIAYPKYTIHQCIIIRHVFHSLKQPLFHKRSNLYILLLQRDLILHLYTWEHHSHPIQTFQFFSTRQICMHSFYPRPPIHGCFNDKHSFNHL